MLSTSSTSASAAGVSALLTSGRKPVICLKLRNLDACNCSDSIADKILYFGIGCLQINSVLLVR